ncbi:MAG: SDR family NAD(P)-dependent oxidoreductase [Bacteroidales bacterium]|nr:SDR family NAD(P)-dependent oxidoreductase [Bacteroidales bacterium]
MKEEIVLVTGASSGIGEACARKFAANGAKVIINARNATKLNALKKELEVEYNAQVFVLPFDVRDRNAAAKCLDSLPESWKTIDILVNNAGLVIGVDKEYEGNMDEWDIVIDTNIKALLGMTRLVVPGMVERGKGHIINIGSIAGDAAYPGGSVYCATKAAVKALSDGLRMDLVHTPLRVTNIKPGLVETNFSVIRFRGDKEKADNVYKGIRPLTGTDIAETVYFAASVPEYMQIAEMLVLPVHQASGTLVYKENN